RLGDFTARGYHLEHNIVDARFISKDVLHLFWADVLPQDNHLRMRCIDFDVKNWTWLHNREVFRLDEFVGSAHDPTVLQLDDKTLHYLWKVDKGLNPEPAKGLYYQAEADGKTVKLSPACEYRAVGIGNRVLV